ncbi:hypothetical protein [Bacillus xiapuensis]|uniref:Uncharacterized protein n=1 Tax=Bacillus xiapuensis TaxID=2014075 RepID=A0ABU6NCP3_9BACI|nr:hypothetical protein [Bacillus xiapuensis]
MEQTSPTKNQVIFATEMTLRMLANNEELSPDMKKSYQDVIRHLKFIVGPKYK